MVIGDINFCGFTYKGITYGCIREEASFYGKNPSNYDLIYNFFRNTNNSDILKAFSRIKWVTESAEDLLYGINSLSGTILGQYLLLNNIEELLEKHKRILTYLNQGNKSRLANINTKLDEDVFIIEDNTLKIKLNNHNNIPVSEEMTESYIINIDTDCLEIHNIKDDKINYIERIN